MIIFLSISLNICFGCSKEPSRWDVEAVLLSTHNICFGWEIRKIIFWYALFCYSSQHAFTSSMDPDQFAFRCQLVLIHIIWALSGKPDFVVCRHERYRPLCTFVQSDQPIRFLFYRKYTRLTFYRPVSVAVQVGLSLIWSENTVDCFSLIKVHLSMFIMVKVNIKVNFTLIAYCFIVRPFLASWDFCHLLMTFANSLDPGQVWQNVGSDPDPNLLSLW